MIWTQKSKLRFATNRFVVFFSLQLVARGTVCRDAVNSCDVPEYCDGINEMASVKFHIIHCDPRQSFRYLFG